MPSSRRASRPSHFVALLALSLASARCSSDDVDSGASSSAGSAATAGTRSEAGAPARAGAGPIAGSSSSEGGASGEGPEAQAGTGTDGAGQAGAGEEPANSIPDLNGCTTADYDDQSATEAPRVIQIAVSGLDFSPRCLTIAAGQTVRFEGSLSAHPLAPGNPNNAHAGSPDSPIQATSSGSSVEFTFADSGTFPYFCELHSFGNGEGMAGVVHVKR